MKKLAIFLIVVIYLGNKDFRAKFMEGYRAGYNSQKKPQARKDPEKVLIRGVDF